MGRFRLTGSVFRVATLVLGLVGLFASSIARADVVRFGSEGANDGILPTYFRGIAVDQDNARIYALDNSEWDRVYGFTSSLSYRVKWGGPGSTPGRFGLPSGVAVEDDGDVLVGEANGYRVQRFSPTGEFLGSWEIAQVTAIAIGNGGDYYVSGADSVRKVAPDGKVLESLFYPGGLNDHYLVDIAFDREHDRLYVLDQRANQVDVLDENLEHIGTWGNPGVGEGDLASPSGIAVAGNRVYISEGTSPGPDRIQRFTTTGEYDGAWYPPGLNEVTSLAIGPEGRLFGEAFSELIRVTPDDPVANLRPVSGTVGVPITLDARDSVVPFSKPDEFSFDLDGNGTYETSRGKTPTATVTFDTPGSHEVGVRVTNGNLSDSFRMNVTVFPAPGAPVPLPPPIGVVSPPPGPPTPPPSGRVGVSINDGAIYTTTASVHLNVVWPSGARTMTVSNDGGFRDATTFGIAKQIDWKLVSSGPERLPKIVYLRFDSSGSQTYSDDIILDDTDPQVLSARFVGSAASASAAFARAAAAKKATLAISARDITSGVTKLQTAVNRSKPGRVVAYKSRVNIPSNTRYVRVRDRAGNWSKWKAVARSKG